MFTPPSSQTGPSNHPDFDCRQLLIFQVLARSLSFTKTATQFSLSQSAVSHSIQHLEGLAGCRLFERSSRRVALTPAGESFLHHVDRILIEMNAAAAALQRIRYWGQSQLRVATPPSLGDTVLPEAVAEVHRLHAQSPVIIETTDRHGAITALLNGRVDLAIVVGQEPDERFEAVPMFRDELVLAVPPNHPWAAAAPNGPLPASIASQTLIAFPRGTYTWNLVLHHLRPDRVNPDNVIECNSIPAIRSLVAAGMGAGVLARWTISDELARGTLVALPMGPRRLFRSWVALSLRIKRLSLPQVQLIDLIRTKAMERFPDLLKSPGPAPAPAPAAEPAPDLPVLAADDSL